MKVKGIKIVSFVGKPLVEESAFESVLNIDSKKECCNNASTPK